MSFKGFQKAVARAPQSFRVKMHMGTQTQDPVYEDAERRFKEIETETKRLSDESKRYHKAVDGMLDHQIGFSKVIEEIYKPISGKASDPNSTKPEGNPEGIEACEQYNAVMKELKDTLKPDLDLIDSKIVQPAQELMKIIEGVRKMATKRNHKQLDLDRHQNSLDSLQKKRDKAARQDETKAMKYEEKIYKTENDVAMAQQEFDYYNEMMKTDLPLMFKLEAEVIQLLFISLYFMQLNVFYTLSSRMEEMKIPYFDLSSDILQAFQAKRGNIEEQAEAIGLTRFKLGYSRSKLENTRKQMALAHGGDPNAPGTASPYGAAPSPYGAAPSPYGSASPAPAYGAPPAAAAAPAYGQSPAYGASPASTYGQPYGKEPPPAAQAAPPAYSPTGYGQTPPASTSTGYGYGDTKTPAATYGAPAAAPPVQPTPPSSTAEMCTAIYDYAAQAQGDLSFPAGARITVVQRTADQNGWWTGSYNGATGVFPGNYVTLG